jgi:catechol 2,3-dioxygenase-like lactoylglutathione lyase family enzyme
MKIKELSIYCDSLDASFPFYRDYFGLSLHHKEENQLTMKVGHSILRLKQNSELVSGFLAFSIQVPGNKVREAKNWYAARAPEVKDRCISSFNGKRSVQSFGLTDNDGNEIELHAFPEIYNPTQAPFGTRHLLNIDSLIFPVRLVEPVSDLLEKTGEINSFINNGENECAMGSSTAYIHLMDFAKASELFNKPVVASPNFELKLETNDRILELVHTNNRLEINEL